MFSLGKGKVRNKPLGFYVKWLVGSVNYVSGHLNMAWLIMARMSMYFLSIIVDMAVWETGDGSGVDR